MFDKFHFNVFKLFDAFFEVFGYDVMMTNQCASQLREIRRIDPKSISILATGVSFTLFVLVAFPYFIWMNKAGLSGSLVLKWLALGVFSSVMMGIVCRLFALSYNWISARFGGLIIETREL